MERLSFEVYLERIRELGPVDEEEITKEINILHSRVMTSSRELDDLPTWEERKVVIDEMIACADKMANLCSLNQAMILYRLEESKKNIWSIIVDLFNR